MAACTKSKSNRLLAELLEDMWERWRSHVASASMLERTRIEEQACEWHAVVGEHYRRWLPDGMAG